MVDVVIASDEGIVLIRRAAGPFEGRWALPGGFVEVGETVEAAATREAAEETGLAVELARLVGVYSDPERDPRGHNVSVAFLARVVGGTRLRPSKHHRRRAGRNGGRYSLGSRQTAFYYFEIRGGTSRR
jgi:ADP-ribose pyrophosphatase YjhB (NUDIX family)